MYFYIVDLSETGKGRTFPSRMNGSDVMKFVDATLSFGGRTDDDDYCLVDTSSMGGYVDVPLLCLYSPTR